MFKQRLLLCLAFLALASNHAAAWDPTKRHPNAELGQTDVQQLNLHGPGSTGDAGGMSATANGADLPRTLAARAADYVNLLDSGPVYFGKDISDDQIAANTTAIQKATKRAIDRGARGVWMPAEDIVYGANAFYVLKAQSFRYAGNGTRLWAAGTDRTNAVGGPVFEKCSGICGFDGSITLDVLHPMYDQGVVTAVTSAYIDVALDWAPTWNDVKIVYSIKQDTPAAYIAVGGTGGLDPGLKLTNVTGLTYRIDLTGSNGVPVTDGSTAGLTVGTEIVLEHQQYGPNGITAINSDRLYVPPGVTVNGAAGVALYSAVTPVTWLGRVEAPFIDTPRGYMRRRLATSADGLHIYSAGAGTYVGGSVADTADDCVNFKQYVGPVQARVDDTHLRVTASSDLGFPAVGQDITLLDANRADQGTFRVKAVTGTPATNAVITLTVDQTLPDSITSSWAMINATQSRYYEIASGFSAKRSRGAGIRISARNVKIGLVHISETMGPALTFTDSGNVEYSPAEDSQIGPLVLRRVNYGLGNERGAAVLWAPSVGKNASGRVRIAGIDIVDTNGPVIAGKNIGQMSIGYIRAANISLNPTPFDGFTVPELAQFTDSGQIEIYEATLFGTTPLPINLRNVDRFRLRNVSNVTAPVTGATALDADTGTPEVYTPTLSALSGATINQATATARYTIRNKVATVYYSVAITDAGAAAGSVLTISTPVGLTAAVPSGGLGRATGGVNMNLSPSIAAGVPAFAVWGEAGNPTIGNGYVLSGQISFLLQ